MGRYYNKTKGMLPVTLASGETLSIPPKQWIFVSDSDDNSASLAKAVGRGQLSKGKVFPKEEVSQVVLTSVVIPVEPEIEVVAELPTVVQNQPPKIKSSSKSLVTLKSDSDETLSDESKRNKE